MTAAHQLRQAVTGLLAFAAAEEELLIAALADGHEDGSPECWAGLPLVAHNTEFKRQQVVRLQAMAAGETPPNFAEVDHTSATVYAACCAPPADVIGGHRATTAALLDAFRAVGDEDLLDPSRNGWLGGRLLWLQVVVRGFWHPTGHIGEYYLSHEQPHRALRLQELAVATAAYLDAPEQVGGMVTYNLACAQARLGHLDAAIESIRQAVALNSDLRANVERDPDLASLRDSGRLASSVGA